MMGEGGGGGGHKLSYTVVLRTESERSGSLSESERSGSLSEPGLIFFHSDLNRQMEFLYFTG